MDTLIRHLKKYSEKGCEEELTSKLSKLRQFDIDITPYTESQIQGWIQHATAMIDAIDDGVDTAAEETDGVAAANEDELTGDEAIAARDEMITKMWLEETKELFESVEKNT